MPINLELQLDYAKQMLEIYIHDDVIDLDSINHYMEMIKIITEEINKQDENI